MTWQPDLAPDNYICCSGCDGLLAVGWLASGHPYPTGVTERSVYGKLCDLRRNPWQPMVFMGVHECDLCQFGGGVSCCANLFIPSNDCIFVAPQLITHFIDAHHYRPPDEFCDAVLACPLMGTAEYRTALHKAGIGTLLKAIREQQQM